MSFTQFLFSLDGRIPRSAYWLKYVLPVTILMAIAAVLDAPQVQSNPTSIGTFTLIVYLLTLYPGIAVGVKRCHDRNRSGWFLLISIIPIVNLWVLVELGFLRGTTGVNNYGQDPLA